MQLRRAKHTDMRFVTSVLIGYIPKILRGQNNLFRIRFQGLIQVLCHSRKSIFTVCMDKPLIAHTWLPSQRYCFQGAHYFPTEVIPRRLKNSLPLLPDSCPPHPPRSSFFAFHSP